MSLMSAIATFGILWFFTLFLVLPFSVRTQGEAKDVTPGTPSSAPADMEMWRVAKRVTLIASVLFVVVAAVLISEIITFEMIENLTRRG